MASIKGFEDLKVPLEEIISATDNFGDNKLIGRGGFGKVYIGQLMLSKKLTTVAIKRLDPALGQGATEFWKEIMMLSRYKHENIVSLVGYCDQNREKILVYEYLSKKSLDLYLADIKLSWTQRLRICIGAAYGLQYLHDPDGTQQRVLHRDIKSANILLDDNWNARISDFGLSKFGPANQEFTYVISNAVGTPGYCDPLYAQTGYLTKESDIYSFGVVLFEVISGRPCVQGYKDNRRFLPELIRHYYQKNKLDTIIYSNLKGQISPDCLKMFLAIAYQCLQIERTKRPSIAAVVKELEIAFQYQAVFDSKKIRKSKRHIALESDSNEYWETKLPHDWQVITRKFDISGDISTTKKELFSYLHKGFLFDENNKFFWINEDGKKCLSISPKIFLDSDQPIYPTENFKLNSRFSVVALYSYGKLHDIKCHIKTSMLSLGTKYVASLVFKYHGQQPIEDHKHPKLMTIKWKMEGLSVFSVHDAKLTADDWYTIEMWHFVNHGLNAEFDISLDELSYAEESNTFDPLIQGIEFQPIDMDEEVEGFDDDDDTDDDRYWMKKLPKNYIFYSKISDEPMKYTTKKELYFHLCEGFVCNHGQMWVSLCKSTGGMCHMLQASQLSMDDYYKGGLDILFLSESRFDQVTRLRYGNEYHFTCRLMPPMFSPRRIYVCYLVFKFADNNFRPISLQAYYNLDGDIPRTDFAQMTVYQPMNIPIIKPKNDDGSHDSSNMPRSEGSLTTKCRMRHPVDGWMEQRKDGWLEIMLCKSLHNLEKHENLNLKLESLDGGFDGIIVEGIEFRPVK